MSPASLLRRLRCGRSTTPWLHVQVLRQPQHAEGLERVQRQVAAIEDLVQRFPLTNPKVNAQPMCNLRA